MALDTSVYYRTLVTDFCKLFEEAGNKCYMICIPCNEAFTRLSIDEKLIKSHILKPSPLLKLNFIPLNTLLISNVEHDERANTLLISRKDKSRVLSKILAIEDAYNSKNQNYKIMLVDKLFTHKNLSSSPPKVPTNTPAKPESNASSDDLLVQFEKCFDYLNKLSPTLTQSVQQKVQQLTKSYIILPNYLHDAANRFEAVVSWAECRFESETRCQNKEMMYSAVESLVTGLAHDIVMAAVIKEFAEEETQLRSKMRELKARCSNVEALGTEKAFNSFKVSAQMKNVLVQLDKQRTPLGKLNELKNLLENVNQGLSKCIESLRTPFSDQETKTILPDDLVAATIYVLINVQPSNLLANIRYIQNFSWHLPSKNEFGYSLVTFEVALEFIRNFSPNASSLTSSGSSSSSPPKHEDNYSNLQAGTKLRKERTCSFHNYRRETSSFDSELDKITKLIERRPSSEGSASTASTSDQGASDPGPLDEELGEFLSGLRVNQFVPGYGKQWQ